MLKSIKLVSWNILHKDHALLYTHLEQEYLAWNYRKPKIIDLILEQKADIICMQEVDSSTIEEDFTLENYNLIWQNDKSRTKVLAKWKADPSGKKPNTLVCAMLIRKDIEILSYKVRSRTLTATCKISDYTFTISTVHLEAGNGIDELHIKHLSKLLDSNVICGDFNSQLDTPTAKYLSDNAFTSTYETWQPEYTYKSERSKLILDYVFHRGTTKNISSITTTGICREFPSDHSMLICELEF